MNNGVALHEIKNFAYNQVSSGYHKEATKNQQAWASLFSVMHMLFVEYEIQSVEPSALFDAKTFRRLLNEKKTFN